jgi:hypothetical protein
MDESCTWNNDYRHTTKNGYGRMYDWKYFIKIYGIAKGQE